MNRLAFWTGWRAGSLWCAFLALPLSVSIAPLPVTPATPEFLRRTNPQTAETPQALSVSDSTKDSTQYLAVNGATCELGSDIQRDRTLVIDIPQHCLDERLGLATLVENARDRANAYADRLGNVPLEVQSIQYEPIAGGVRIRSDLGIDNAILGFLDVRLFQDVLAEVNQGELSVRAGETRVVLDVPIFGGGDMTGLVRQVVNNQLQVLNGKHISELIVETGLDRVMAQQSGLDREAINFIVSSVEKDVSVELTESGAILTINFR